ncbi:MAG TPA: tetratricopeptide repeat protein [Pyrinomonadaceae bacterium]|nr:tetratricopeptide repeat protein [Pyrinomonadaceae bacterium]
MKRRLVLFSVLFSICFSIQIFAQGFGDRNKAGDGRYRINGKIVLPNGQPAIGIKVALRGADFTNSSVETDKEGKFVFDSIPAGNYNVQVTDVQEFNPVNESLTIARDTTPGQSYNLVINLITNLRGQKPNNLFAKVPKDAMGKFEEALDYFKKGEYKTVFTLLQEAIQKYPDFAAAYNLAGEAFLKMNDFDHALGAFSNAIAIQSDYYEAKLNYGFTLFSMKDYKDAEKVMRELVVQKNDAPLPYYYLGMSLVHLNQNDEAETHLLKAISLKGGESLALAHRYLGGIYIEKKMNDKAISQLEKYVELAPKAGDIEKIKSTIAELKKQPK